MKTQAQIVAENATGCAENRHGLGKYYNHHGAELTVDQAAQELTEGGTVEVPNAGAGSYRRFFMSVYFTDCRSMETSSSAGDWTLAVKDGDFWYVASQSNRYPYHGFSYSVDRDFAAESFEELCRAAFD